MLVYRLWMLGLLLFTGIHFGIKNGSANKSSDPGGVAFVPMNTNSQKIENDRRGQNRGESRKSRRH